MLTETAAGQEVPFYLLPTLGGSTTLRGFLDDRFRDRDLLLFNAEYRFPIINLDRGLSTLPIFLSRVTGNVFLDCGSAFDNAYAAEFKTGTGGELWFDFQLGYILDFTFRAGLARGLASEGITKAYFVSTIPF